MRRGFSLIELIVSMAIMAFVIAGVMGIFMSATRMTNVAEKSADNNETARLAMDEVAHAVKHAGIGSPGGVWINVGGTPTKTNPIFGVDGTTGFGGTPAAATTFERDDLWMIVPNRNAMRQACVDSGAAASVVRAGTGIINLTCIGSFAGLPNGSMLLASNMTTSALLSGPFTKTAGTPSTLDYAESGIAGFSNAPEKGGYQVGDMVMPVLAVHYFVAPDPQANNNPALWKAVGTVGTDALGRPLIDTALVGVAVADVEDFQVAYGFDTTLAGNPDTYTFQNGLGPVWIDGLRSLRVTLTVRSKRRVDSEANVTSRKAINAENHVPPATVDGFYRVVYTRRIELPNLAAANL